MPRIRVNQGESISSIATTHGLQWETAWNQAENAELRARRRDPNVLCPGDELFVPERTLKQVNAGTELRHRYRRKGVPDTLRLQILYEGEIQASKPYVLDVEGRTFEGSTDAEGRLQHPVSPGARRARLTVGTGDDALVFQLQLGHLEPTDEVAGVQARLRNLGYDPGQIEGKVGDAIQEALRAFQEAEGLEETGECDDDTASRLRDEHAS